MLLAFLEWLLGVLRTLAESNFVTAAIGSLVGAWGGAYAIQRIAEKAKKRDALLQELRACCHAIEMAHSVGSTYIGLKKQHVKRLKDEYYAQRARVHAFKAAREAGEVNADAQLHVGLDCQTMDVVRTRAAYLEAHVVEKMSAPMRPRAIAVVLTRCTDQLNQSIEQRNDVLRRFEAMPEGERVARAFGLPIPYGIDHLYRDYVDAIYNTRTTAFISRGCFRTTLCSTASAFGSVSKGSPPANAARCYDDPCSVLDRW